MKSLLNLLEEKGRDPVTVASDETVFHAISLMAKHDIGALLVMKEDRLVGIFSERDFTRKVSLRGKSSKETLVREVMTEKVIYVTLSQTVEECLAIMTDRRVRHLPVLDEAQRVVGFLSIGDLVKETISEQAFIIDQLEHYITN